MYFADMDFHQCACTAWLAWASPSRAWDWVVVDAGEDLAQRNVGLGGSSNHCLWAKRETRRGEASGWGRNFHHSMMLVLWFNTIKVWFFSSFFSVLEENGGGHPTTESEITLQSRGQTTTKLQPATAGKEADQRLTSWLQLSSGLLKCIPLVQQSQQNHGPKEQVG